MYFICMYESFVSFFVFIFFVSITIKGLIYNSFCLSFLPEYLQYLGQVPTQYISYQTIQVSFDGTLLRVKRSPNDTTFKSSLFVASVFIVVY